MKRIVKKSWTTKENCQKRRKNKLILDWENFWKRYAEKKNQSVTQLRKKRVHIKWKRGDPIKQMDTTVSLKNGGGHRFLLCSEEDTIVSIKQKAIELYFPNGKNKYGEEGQNCTINIQDASGVLVNEDKLYQHF